MLRLSAPLSGWKNTKDFKSCHPHYGTPLMATVHSAVVCPGGKMLGSKGSFLGREFMWIYGSYRSYPTYFQHTLRSIDQHISPVFGALSRSSHPFFFSSKPRQDEERIHDLIRWCMGMGADPRAVALRADAMSVGLPPSPPGTGWKVDLPAIVVGLVFS